MITKESIELGLYSSKPIHVGEVPVRSVSLDEIAEMGIPKFNGLLSLMCSSLSDIPGVEFTGDITYFDILISSAYEDKEMREKIYKAFELFIGEVPTIDAKNVSFIFPSGYSINKENFKDIQTVIRIRNGITEKSDDDYNPADEKARAVIERMKQLKKKVAKAKPETSNISFGELISATAAGLQIPMWEIMRYDMYQFNDQLNRMRLFKDWDTNIQALVHGAKSEDVNLKHWLSRLTDNEEDE